MEQNKDNIPSQEVMDSPSANTRSKATEAGGQDKMNNYNSPNISPKKEKQSSNIKPKGNRTPVSNIHSPNSAKGSKSKLSEIRAAALKKKREAIAKGSAVLNQAIYDPDATAREAKYIVKNETGLIVDEFMERHFSPWDDNHVERPERLQYIRKRIDDLGLTHRCKKITSKLATDEELLLFHSEEHINYLKHLVESNYDDIMSECCKNDIYVNKDSLQAARMAAGSAIQLTKDIISGNIQNGLCLIRPPGHHAMKTEPNGFCLFNNVGIAAKYALLNESFKNCDTNNTEPQINEENVDMRIKVRKILIVDFDVHHGQGTQYGFYDDPNVMYFSIHRYEKGQFWPNLRESDFDSVGAGKGSGYNCNLPLNSSGMSDSDYLAIVHQILLPIAYEFQPDIVMVEAGFDAAIADPEGEMKLSPAAYGHIIHALMALAKGRIGVFLEGGYFLDSLAEGAAMTLRALLGDFNINLGPRMPLQDSLISAVLNLKFALKPYWKNLNIHPEVEQDQCELSEASASNVKLHLPSIVYKEVTARVDNWMTGQYNPSDHYHQHSQETYHDFKEKVMALRQAYNMHLDRYKVLKPKRLALAFDRKMMAHYNTEEDDHPEKPARVDKIIQIHEEYGILTRTEEVMHVHSRKATKEEICLVHDESHWNRMSDLPSLDQNELNSYADTLDSIYLNPESFDSALLSAGNVLAVVDAVCNDDAQKGVAIVRPPGHHAEADDACGFCLFNNAAVAAKYALDTHNMKKVLIVDWDVHHGNGIQNIFYASSNVLYISLHRYDHGTFFPGRPDAGSNFVGSGKGEGFNINIPWNGSGMGDTEYALAFYNIVLPIAYEFNPDLVLVSAGFDAARGDPLGKCKVSPEMYAHMTHHLSVLANGKIIVILEGGYNLNAISLSMTLCTKTLLGDPLPPLAPYKPPIPSAVATIQKVIAEHSRFWTSLNAFSCSFVKNKMIDIIWETAVSSQGASNSIQSNQRDSLSDTTLLNESLPILPSCTLDVNVADDCVKDSEYIPFQFGRSVTVAGVNTVSNQFRQQEAKSFNIVIDSSDYASGKKSHATSETINIPTPLADQIEKLAIASTPEQASSLPDYVSISEGNDTMSNSRNPNTHLTNDYIPFQYGSYQGSSSVYTFTKSEVSQKFKTENTTTTDSNTILIFS